MSASGSRWPEVPLGEVCEFKYGKSLPESARAGGDVPVFGSNGQVGRHGEAITSGPTIVIGRKGSFGEVNFSPVPCWPIDTTYYVDHTATKADLHWLAYRLAALGLNKLNKAAAVPGLNRDDAYRQRLLLPPLPEQRRMAEILDKADTLRAKRHAALAQLDSLTQAIFLDMFGDPIANSRQFPTRPMIELIDSARPITYGILMPGPDQPEGVKYVRVVDMQDGGIAMSGIRKTTEAISNAYRRSLLKPGDLLMSIRGHVGRFAVVPPELDGANITQDTARLAVVGADSVFVRECLRTVGFQRWMAKHTKGVAVRGINLTDVKLMPIILPPLGEQQRFAGLATATRQLRAAERAAHRELDGLFASLQHRAFRGEI
jgi:type I restriction enzyme S subunit